MLIFSSPDYLSSLVSLFLMDGPICSWGFASSSHLLLFESSLQNRDWQVDMADKYCNNCGSSTESAYDSVTGDDTCLECGCVMSSFAIVETFQFQCRDDNNPEPAVQQPPQTKRQRDLAPKSRIQLQAMTPKERSLRDALLAMRAMCERVTENNTLKEEAMDLVEQYEIQRPPHGRRVNDPIIIAIIYLASKRINQTIPIERICRNIDLIDPKLVKKMYNKVVQKVMKFDEGFVKIRELVPAAIEPIRGRIGDAWRFTYQTNISDMADFAFTEDLNNHRPRPINIVLACICLVVEHYNLGLSVEEVVKCYNDFAGQTIAIGTIRTRLRDWETIKHDLLAKIK